VAATLSWFLKSQGGSQVLASGRILSVPDLVDTVSTEMPNSMFVSPVSKPVERDAAAKADID